jgi:hypothetical protein
VEYVLWDTIATMKYNICREPFVAIWSILLAKAPINHDRSALSLNGRCKTPHEHYNTFYASLCAKLDIKYVSDGQN